MSHSNLSPDYNVGHSGPGIRAVDLFRLLAQNLMDLMEINPDYL
jgi:hypothetical protein